MLNPPSLRPAGAVTLGGGLAGFGAVAGGWAAFGVGAAISLVGGFVLGTARELSLQAANNKPIDWSKALINGAVTAVTTFACAMMAGASADKLLGSTLQVLAKFSTWGPAIYDGVIMMLVDFIANLVINFREIIEHWAT